MGMLKLLINNRNYQPDQLKVNLKETKEKLSGVFDNILADLFTSLNRKKEQLFSDLDKHYETLIQSMKNYNARLDNLTQENKELVNLSTALVTNINECQNTKEYEELIMSAHEIFQIKSTDIKEEAAELKAMAPSLVELLESKMNSANLRDDFKNKVLPIVVKYFEQGGSLNDKVGHKDPLLLKVQELKAREQAQQPMSESLQQPAKALYFKLNIARCKVKNPNCDANQIREKLEGEWRELSQKERAGYVEMGGKGEEEDRVEGRGFEESGGYLSFKKLRKE